jgi:hypothetical protein
MPVNHEQVELGEASANEPIFGPKVPISKGWSVNPGQRPCLCRQYHKSH